MSNNTKDTNNTKDIIVDQFNRMFFKNDNETYSLRVITDWLKQKNIKFIYSSAPVDRYGMYQHGIKVSFPTFELSIQTHPMIAGWSFAETLKTNNILNEVRHDTPETLFEYIDELLTTEDINE
jgi:hypothetical protein